MIKVILKELQGFLIYCAIAKCQRVARRSNSEMLGATGVAPSLLGDFYKRVEIRYTRPY